MNSAMNTTVHAQASAEQSLVRLTHITYGLHAIGLAMGVFGSSTIVGAFLGLPSVIALILNYVKRSDVRGTWLDTHFSWQIRTFWWVLAWTVIIGLVSAPLTLVLIGFGTWFIGIALVGIWAIYRIVRGWLHLRDGQTMPI
jgi:uncharacterized membrane protein